MNNNYHPEDSHLATEMETQFLPLKHLDSNEVIGAARHFPVHPLDPSIQGKYEQKIKSACKVVTKFFKPKILKDQSIPLELLHEAQGLVFLTIYKAGFLLAGKVGTGFVISRTAEGWSAPLFIGTGGFGFGMMAGGEMVNYVIILGSQGAVKTFSRNGQLQIGSELDIAVGPIGRATAASINIGRAGIAPNFSYSHSTGLFGGIGLSGAVVATRKKLNTKCYGHRVTASDILSGAVKRPEALPLFELLDRILRIKRYCDKQNNAMVASAPCHDCGYVNLIKSRTCAQCNSLVIFSNGYHSGRRRTGKLIVRKDLVN